MAYDAETFMGDDPQILLKRFAEYVKPFPIKTLAELAGCTDKTAEHFRNGTSWPTARHWRLIVRAFGRDVLAAVFDPEINDTLARLNREQAQLEARLDDIRSRRRAATGHFDIVPERRDASEDRPPLAEGPPSLDLFEDAR